MTLLLKELAAPHSRLVSATGQGNAFSAWLPGAARHPEGHSQSAAAHRSAPKALLALDAPLHFMPRGLQPGHSAEHRTPPLHTHLRVHPTLRATHSATPKRGGTGARQEPPQTRDRRPQWLSVLKHAAVPPHPQQRAPRSLQSPFTQPTENDRKEGGMPDANRAHAHQACLVPFRRDQVCDHKRRNSCSKL